MMPDKKKVIEYYNSMSSRQLETGINKRHRSIFNWLKEFGLRIDSNILEIGSGVGSLTNLLAEEISKGQITAIDISNESIRKAKQQLANFENIQWMVCDIFDFDLNKQYDFIILPDVLEHIPQDDHARLFKKLNYLLKDDGDVIIHIPNPYYLEWMRLNEPDKLQIIDQPITTDLLIKNCYPHGFYIHYLSTYSIWIENNDYQIIRLKKVIEREYNLIKEKKFGILSRLIHKIKL